MAGEQLESPNKQAVGLDPPWVEGTGGAGAASRRGRKPQQRKADSEPAKQEDKPEDKKADEEQ